MGGVQLCTHEYLSYIQSAGYTVREFTIEASIGFVTKLKIKAGLDVYEHYPINNYLQNLSQTINSERIKLVFLNQLSLAHWAEELKPMVATDVRFIGLSHGNESGDYIHQITQLNKPSRLQTWKLGKLLVNEVKLFSKALDGVLVLSELESAIDQWLGANHVLYLPRLLSPQFLPWQPAVANAGFAGTLDHLPNLLGIEQLAASLQKQNFGHQLNLVGGPAHLGQKLEKAYSFIKYKGPLGDDELAEEVKSWSVFINPVFWYARGSSTKLARAINWGIPCLTTPAGRRGYELTNESVTTADNTPETFAAALINVLNNPPALQQLRTATVENAENFKASLYIDSLKVFLNKFWKP